MPNLVSHGIEVVYDSAGKKIGELHHRYLPANPQAQPKPKLTISQAAAKHGLCVHCLYETSQCHCASADTIGEKLDAAIKVMAQRRA